MAEMGTVVPLERVASVGSEASAHVRDGLPGRVRPRGELPTPAAYAIVDVETTGTDPAVDEIVSLAVVRLDPDGAETARFATLVRPSRPIPPEATAVHGITDEDVAHAPAFAELAPTVVGLLDGAVFGAHNAAFDLAMLQHALAEVGIQYRPIGVACTLEAFRLLEPLADSHRLEAICARHGIVLADAHEALGDVVATAALVRLLLARGIAPETVELDSAAYLRLRARGDTRPASEPQIRRVFGLARAAGLVRPDGAVDRDAVLALVERVTGVPDVDRLTREQVQDVFDALEALTRERTAFAAASGA
jgi:DNA polymerase III epsilon subunit family exonuclease